MGECREHLQALPALDGTTSELCLQVTNLFSLAAPRIVFQMDLTFLCVLVDQVDLALQFVAKVVSLGRVSPVRLRDIII
jgi:hypothetical protein